VAIDNCRGCTKADLPENMATPHIEVDPNTHAVKVGGEPIEHEPAKRLPMTPRYFLF
jgi:urease subunit alpha